MLRHIISHLSLFAVLLHLHWGCCAHLAACEQAQPTVDCCHGHDHDAADQPVIPAHDDCHESHADAVLSAALVAPSPDGIAALIPVDAAAVTAQFAASISSASFGHADDLGPLPLRASPRSPVLLN